METAVQAFPSSDTIIPFNRSYAIATLEAEMVKLSQVECPTEHHVANGIYTKRTIIPADTLAVGHHQRFDHINIMVRGKVTMLNEDGTETLLEAPLQFIGKPGRKCGYIHEEIEWINVYHTDLTDPQEAEDYFFDKSIAAPHPALTARGDGGSLSWQG